MGAVAIKRVLVPTRSCSTIQHLAVCNYHTYAAHIMHLLFHFQLSLSLYCFFVVSLPIYKFTKRTNVYSKSRHML